MADIKLIGKELAAHIPFTAFGAATGIGIMLIIIFGNVSRNISYMAFYIFHPLHILLSALVTTSMYLKYSKEKWLLLCAVLIGYWGSVGICTISDIILPYFGGILFGAEMEFELGFIAKWWLVNPLAFVGIAIAHWKPITKCPHMGHVLLSTWASLLYFTAFGVADWYPLLPIVFLILFVAVWFPCCFSDIIFPLLFIREKKSHLHGHHKAMGI
ncbi:MAG: hypothetical protein AB1779_06585 [Candidatus Thermoplasmatota archaeon]